MDCAYLQAAHLAVHISFGLVATAPEDGRNHTGTHPHTLIHICLLRSPLLSFIFYSKVLSRNKRIGQSSQSDEREGKVVCVCLSVGGGAEDTFAYSSFFLSPPPAVGRGAL